MLEPCNVYQNRWVVVRRRSMHWDLSVEAGGRILANLFNALWLDAKPLWPIVCPDVTVEQDWRADVPVPEDYYAM